jgi:hypothetical protein
MMNDRLIRKCSKFSAGFILCLLIAVSGFSQNVGIGTSAPETPLHVNGTTRIGLDTLSDGKLELRGNNIIELGAGKTKEANAGKIGYQKFSSGLDIVGAGATVATRKVTIFNEGGGEFKGGIDVNGNINSTKAVIAKDSVKGNVLLARSLDNETVKDKLEIFSPFKSAVDQESDGNSASACNVCSDPAWQSFTAGVSGTIYNVGFNVSNFHDFEQRTLKMYKGEGVHPDSLINTYTMPLATGIFVYTPALNIPVVAGRKYTMWLSSIETIWEAYDNPYSGGMFSEDNNRDLRFKTYMLVSSEKSVFAVTNQGDVNASGKITVPTIKITEGAGANKILTSDATGNASWTNPTVPANYWTTANNDVYNNNAGSVGIGNSSPLGSLDVSSTTNTPLYVRGQNSQLRLIENDNSNKQWKAEVNNGNFQITEEAIATPIVINAGSDNNVLVTRNDSVQVKKLIIGTNGTAIAKMLNSQTAIGSGSPGVNTFTIPFSTSFTSIPKVVATIETQNFNDLFLLNVKEITMTDFKVMVYRMDGANLGSSWSQNLKVNWTAWE